MKEYERLLGRLVLLALCARRAAAEAAPAPFGIIQAGDARVALQRNGVFWLASGDKLRTLTSLLSDDRLHAADAHGSDEYPLGRRVAPSPAERR